MNKYQQDKYWDYKEQVVEKLISKYEVYFRKAEVAVLDMKGYVILGFKEKWTPEQTADNMIGPYRDVARRVQEKLAAEKNLP